LLLPNGYHNIHIVDGLLLLIPRGWNMSERVIETSGLKRDFGNFTAVDKVTFNVEKGELFGLLGPNGAGKTTLLKFLTGQLEPTSGSCQVLGIDPAKDSIGVKSRIEKRWDRESFMF
jgi:ABC-2 type transport system ATP-binding protein